MNALLREMETTERADQCKPRPADLDPAQHGRARPLSSCAASSRAAPARRRPHLEPGLLRRRERGDDAPRDLLSLAMSALAPVRFHGDAGKARNHVKCTWRHRLSGRCTVELGNRVTVRAQRRRHGAAAASLRVMRMHRCSAASLMSNTVSAGLRVSTSKWPSDCGMMSTHREGIGIFVELDAGQPLRRIFAKTFWDRKPWLSLPELIDKL